MVEKEVYLNKMDPISDNEIVNTFERIRYKNIPSVLVQKNTVYFCKTKELELDFCKKLSYLGLRLTTGESYLNFTIPYEEEEICFDVYHGYIITKKQAEILGFHIINYEKTE